MGSILQQTKALARDVRVRDFVAPVRVAYIAGTVEHTEALLTPQALQIGLNEPNTCRLRNCADGEHASVVLDYGKELHGGVRLLCARTKGCTYPRVRLTFGESLTEAMSTLGTKNAGNDHAVRDMVVPVPAMSDQKWGQTGFRFVRIELLETETSLELKSAPAVFVYRDLPYRGEFSCSDPLLNRIYDTAAYTCHLCMQGLLWDGIKRDRLVWIGDSHPEMLTIRALFGAQPMLEDSLDSIREATPLPGWMNGIPAYSMWWLCILWDWYQYTGEARYPQKQAAYIAGLTRQLLEVIGEDGELKLDGYFLDWSTADPAMCGGEAAYGYGTPAGRSGVQALAVLAMQAASGLCRLIGEKALSGQAQEGADRLCAYGGDWHGAKPTGAMLYLADMAAPSVTAKNLNEGGAAGFSTFMSYYILRALAETAGAGEALNRLREYYGGMLALGATTFWEDFSLDWAKNAAPIDRLPQKGETDIHGDFGAYCYTQFRHSLCHGWASGPVPFLTETVLGIRIEEIGCKRMSVTPQLGDLQWAQGAFTLPQGVLRVRHERQADGQIATWTEAPEGVTVETHGCVRQA